MTASDFTLDAYRALLDAFLSDGYRVASFHDADPARKDLILRHDLDFSLEAALPVAEIEADLGRAATYFVLARTEMYNIHAPSAENALGRLIAFGHEIGLHFDASLYGGDRAEMDRAVDRECARLEEVVGQPVRVVSFHRPARDLLGGNAPLGGRAHAYQSRYFEKMGYCSDSRGGWHHGHPLEHPARERGTALQLLTHPIWWTSEYAGDPVLVLDAFRAGRDARLAADISANCDPYRQARGEEPGPMINDGKRK